MNEIRFNSETELQWKLSKMTLEEKVAYMKALSENKNSQENQKLFESTKLDEGETTITQEGVDIKLYSTTLSKEQSKTLPELENKLPNPKDEKETLAFMLYGNAINWYDCMSEVDISKFEFKKDSKGRITDIYPKDLDKSADISHHIPDRYALRYDSNGNITKTFIQDIDENGNVRGQEIKNYNTDGTQKNTQYYRYTFDEQGNKTGQTYKVISQSYGNETHVLSKIFGVDTSNIMQITCNKIQEIGEGLIYSYKEISNVLRTSDGKISELTYNGERYMLRYDSDGNLQKAIKQSFDDDGKIIAQQIDEYNVSMSPSAKEKVSSYYTYRYNENGNRLPGAIVDVDNKNAKDIAVKICGIPEYTSTLMPIYPNTTIGAPALRPVKVPFTPSNVQYDSSGRVTSFIAEGNPCYEYNITYDKDGNVVKYTKVNARYLLKDSIEENNKISQ